MSQAEYLVRLTDLAVSDLEALYYHSLTTRSPTLGGKLLEQIEDVVSSLEMFPERGSYPAELIDLGNYDVRQLVSWPYRVIYEIRGKTVEVTAIIDGRRNVKALLQQRLLYK